MSEHPCRGCGEEISGTPCDPKYVHFHPRCFKAFCRGAGRKPIEIMHKSNMWQGEVDSASPEETR